MKFRKLRFFIARVRQLIFISVRWNIAQSTALREYILKMGKLFIRNWKLKILQGFEVGKKSKNHQNFANSTLKINENHQKMFKSATKKMLNCLRGSRHSRNMIFGILQLQTNSNGGKIANSKKKKSWFFLYVKF